MAIGLPLEFSFLALEYLSSGLFTVLLSFSGMGTIIVAHFLLTDERATLNKLLGAGLALVGVVILVVTRTTGLLGQSDLRGYLFALGVILLFSFGNVYARRRLGQVEAPVATAIGIGSSLIISLLFTLLTSGLDSLGQIGGWRWSAAIYSSVVGSFLYFYAVYWTIKRHGATTVGLAYFVIPVVSTLLGTALLGEIVSWGMLGGAMFVFGGLVLVHRPGNGARAEKVG
jgi:drug/metabolite transporter (DMT)-like permease